MSGKLISNVSVVKIVYSTAVKSASVYKVGNSVRNEVGTPLLMQPCPAGWRVIRNLLCWTNGSHTRCQNISCLMC